MTLFHITTRDAWELAEKTGEHRPASLDSEGFVHLSREGQWLGAANRFFRGRTGLVLLTIREDRVRGEVRDEEADGERFPHLYGPLPVDAVVEVLELPVGADGAIGRPPRKP